MSFTEILSIALQMILSLSILVILHECGHFFPARWFKTRVEKFYLFFDPYFSLFKKKIGDTEYGIGWIPFGGYVKISGMIDESMDKEQMEGPPQPWEFRSKKAWQRLIIMVGGVVVNFILGFLIFAMLLFVFGKSYFKTEDLKYGIATEAPAEMLGLKNGDKILSVGGTDIINASPGKVLNEIILNNAQSMTVERSGQAITIPIAEDAVSKLTSDYKGIPLYTPRVPHEIVKLIEDGPAAKAGIQANDKILSINGAAAEYVNDIQSQIKNNIGQSIDLQVLRGQDTLAMKAQLDSSGVFGVFFKPADQLLTVSREKFGFFESFPAGVREGVGFLDSQLKAFGQMFRGKIKATENLGSVFSIASLFDPSWDWEKFWRITAMLSIILGFFNILPIPALDGGYVLFLFWEIITGKKPNDKFMEYVTIGGFILLVGLMIFALGLDISRWFK